MRAKLKQLLDAPWQHYQQIDSTSAFIAHKNLGELESGFTCSADSQTQGYGRDNRFWHSPVGGLYISVLLKPLQPPAFWNLFSFGAALAAAEAIERSCPEMRIQLKWPNDLIFKRTKIGGIIIQSISGSTASLVVGIGINVSVEITEMKRLIYPAASLKHFANKPPRVADLARICRDSLCRHFIRWEETPDYFLEQWRKRSCTHGNKITFNGPEGVVTGMCLDIDSNGFLQIETREGIKTYCTGDIVEISEI